MIGNYILILYRCATKLLHSCIFMPWLSVLCVLLLVPLVTYSVRYWAECTDLTLLVSATATLLLALIQLPSRLIYNRYIVLIFVLFLIATYGYVHTDNIFELFLLYELFLLPSTYLVYALSPNRRSVRSAVFFLLWTQAGSMLVLAAILLLVSLNNTTAISCMSQSTTIINLLVFLGFGVKVPIFPLYFWLTKTHVEAITSFSIFLSGFLVKLAVFGFLKLYPVLGLYGWNFGLFVVAVSTTVATLMLLVQVDYKKIVAYATIQEMNLIMLLLLLTAGECTTATNQLLLVHTLLSGGMFSLSDSLYKRFSTRQVQSIYGLSMTAPKLVMVSVTILLILKSFPLTSKFPIELVIVGSLALKNVALMLLILITIVFIGNYYYTFRCFGLVFGSNNKSIVLDLTIKELVLFSIVISALLSI